MDQFDLLIKNGMVYLDDRFEPLDVGVRGGRIAVLLQRGAAARGIRELDAAGRYVLPGMIDFHGHIREPGPQSFKEDYESGTKAAANGGVTMICTPPNGLLRSLADAEAYDAAVAAGEKGAVIDFHPVASPLGYAAGALEELSKRTALFKIMELDYKTPLSESFGTADSLILDECFAAVARQGKYCGIHPMDNRFYFSKVARLKAGEGPKDLRHILPELYGDEEMSAGAWHLAYYIRKHHLRWHALHCWQSGYIDLVRIMKSLGEDVIASLELLPTNSLPVGPGGERSDELVQPSTGLRIPLGHCAPPDWDKVWEAVRDGTIDILGSDHSPHLAENYNPGDAFATPSGVPGLDWYGHLLLNEVNKGSLTLERLVQVTSEAGCKAFGWYPRKGSNLPGTDADFSICDMDRVWTIGEEPIYTKSGLCPYYGLTIKGRVTQTVVRGSVVMDEGRILAQPGYGRYVRPE